MMNIRKNSRIEILSEPLLEFRYGQYLTRPHDGLALFGPYDAELGSRPGAITYGLIGPLEGLKKFLDWAQVMKGPVLSPRELDTVLWPSFPGFETVFDSQWPNKPAWEYCVDRKALLYAARNRDKNKRVFEVVNLFLKPFELLGKIDYPIGVMVCVVPDEVWKNCRPLVNMIEDGHGYKLSYKEYKSRRRGEMLLFESLDPTIYQMSPDFRRQLKARAMKYSMPIQIIRESTLQIQTNAIGQERDMSPISDRMWNLATTLYYKCGGKPWRLASAREGVCYVGIAFKLEDPRTTSRNGCCAAQMFLDDGDGVVFLGEYGPWYAPERKQFHLSKDAARNLMRGILKTYGELKGKPLREVFLHSWSGIDEDEFQGYKDACPEGCQVIAVRVRSEYTLDGVRLYRTGTLPIVRGSFWELNETSGYLWASGFTPELGTYAGWDVPIPLRIDIQHGEASIQQVARDILALTKLNYNACKVGDAKPVTVLFSDAVGEILVANPNITSRRPNFKFYI